MPNKNLGEYMLCDNKEKDKLTFYQGALEKHERERATFFFFKSAPS